MRICLCLLLIASTAHADSLAVAREHYSKGTKAFEVGQYDEAAREFAEAYKIKDDPVILYHSAAAATFEESIVTRSPVEKPAPLVEMQTDSFSLR
jgi:hypothetical protein